MKKVLVIGGGGREHAIVDALSHSPQVNKIYCAPGNAGISKQAECINIKDTDIIALKDFAIKNAIDLTIVGPEAALVAGITDEFHNARLKIFGHTKTATQIESSKEFAKKLMLKYSIPTASYKSFDNYDEALSYVHKEEMPIVLKYDGLAAGKGVVIAYTKEEAETALKDMLFDETFGKGKVVIEDYLSGPEFSFMCFVNGRDVYPMPLAQDHKRAFDGDCGPNTGGMGAYTALPFITVEDYKFALEEIMKKTAYAMVEEGHPLTGVLYGGLMKTKDGIKVIEFNARFGDPETEVVLPLLESDIYDLFSFDFSKVQWSSKCSLGVVMASKGYPKKYDKGFIIDKLDDVQAKVYHMGTTFDDFGNTITAGGRVLIIISVGDDVAEIQKDVYREIENINCENLFFRHDIAHQAIK